MSIQTKFHIEKTTPQTQKHTPSPKSFVVEELLADEDVKNLVASFFQENQDIIQNWLDKEEAQAFELPYVQPTPFSPILTPEVSPIQNTAEVMEVFEKMVSQMEVIHHAGDTTTTLYLNSSQFENSLFYGSQIIIEEFNTSPKTFNVTFISQPEAATLFKNHLEALMEHFKHKQKDLPFSIHRMEVNLIQEDEPLYRSSERDNRENQEEEQE